MRKIKLPALSGYLLLLFVFYYFSHASAQNSAAATKFDLKNGDRVVFLGNSIFENDFEYGYLELALTTRFPDRDVTFRNLGWSGDNVFGDARSTFTNPPTAYQHLIRNIDDAKPSVVLLAYGGVEAQEGEAGLPRFKEGLAKLIDKFDQMGATTVLLSPIPIIGGDSSANVAKRNADLELYASAISKMASERGKLFVDIYKPVQEISKKAVITENGVHLNAAGYYYLAGILEKGLGLTSQSNSGNISFSKNGSEAASPVKIVSSGKANADLEFTMDEKYIALPIPDSLKEPAQTIKISGLKKGFYTLKTDQENIVTASAKQWAAGVEIKQGPAFTQIGEVHKMILQKNLLHFYQYRPMNETYIIGFRAYEQGKHVQDLADQSILIKWLESQIALNRGPKSQVYKLTALK